MPKKYKYKKSFSFQGKRYYVYADTMEELIEKKTLKLSALQRGETVVSSSMLVSEWADRAVKTYKTNLTGRSRIEYEGLMKRAILSEIGNRPLKTIRPLDLQCVLNLQAGKSATQINSVHQQLNFLFSKAEENGLIPKNPAAFLSRPKAAQKKNRRALTEYEQKMLYRALDKHPHGLYFLLMLDCGCRPSEAARIEGRDIITKDGRDYLHIRGTKSAAADRYVPLTDRVRSHLPEGYKHRPFELLNQTAAGRPIDRQAHKRAWDSLRRLVNIEMGCKVYRNEVIPPYRFDGDITPYYLRHTYCSRLQEQGIDLRVAQKLMGHSDIQMTANIYTHQTDAALSDAWDALNQTDQTLKSAEI